MYNTYNTNRAKNGNNCRELIYVAQHNYLRRWDFKILSLTVSVFFIFYYYYYLHTHTHTYYNTPAFVLSASMVFLLQRFEFNSIQIQILNSIDNSSTRPQGSNHCNSNFQWLKNERIPPLVRLNILPLRFCALSWIS